MAEERIIAYREALREAMNEEMRNDPNIFLMGEEVAEYNGAYKVSQGMLDEFGAKRVIDTPIAELGFAGIGVGAAMNGLRLTHREQQLVRLTVAGGATGTQGVGAEVEATLMPFGVHELTDQL